MWRSLGTEMTKKTKKHKDETFYKKAQQEGLRSRAAFKLRQIQAKYKLFDTASHVLDLCCSPGSWIQAIKLKFPEISIIGVDLIKMRPIQNVIFIQGDIREDALIQKIERAAPSKFDVILSDCAHKFIGARATDYARHLFLVERVVTITNQLLKSNGHLICKLFNSDQIKTIRNKMKLIFKQVFLFKPEASLKKSPELYLVCKFFKK